MDSIYLGCSLVMVLYATNICTLKFFVHRVVRTLTYMMYLIHIETCGYYAMSAFEGLGINEWVYDGYGIA